MRTVIQRVASAHVAVAGVEIGAIGQGILLLLGIEKGDTTVNSQKLLDKVLGLRIFSDAEGAMNLSLRDVEGGLLVVSQFTLAADLRKGKRPSFDSAEKPAVAKKLYDEFLSLAKDAWLNTASGQFGADMQLTLINDGPVTFVVET